MTSFTSELRIDTSGHIGLDGTPGTNGRRGPQQLSSSLKHASGGWVGTSGAHGKHSSLPLNNSLQHGSEGWPGTNGTHGDHGKDAKDIRLTLAALGNKIIANWDGKTAYLAFGTADNAILLRAVGGNGGHGGDGGKGEDGGNGGKGQNATRHSRGSDGTNGGNGGDGGNGANGGKGGKGGTVRLITTFTDTDLFMLQHSVYTQGGRGGKGGIGGHGGIGGKGGPGGDAYQWKEWDSSQQIHKTCSNPGGNKGRDGVDGKSGSKGADGINGPNGSFKYVVDGVEHDSLYNLMVSIKKIVSVTSSNPEGIFEPGEKVNFEVSVANNGSMSSPPQEIQITCADDVWLKKTGSNLSFQESIAPRKNYLFRQYLSFVVIDNYQPKEDPLCIEKTLKFQALFVRVNKLLPSVSMQKCTIQYPAQLEPISGRNAIAIDETAIINVIFKNISSFSLGKKGEQKRHLYASVEVTDQGDAKSNDVQLLSAKNEPQNENKLILPIEYLKESSSIQQSISLRFLNSHLQPYSKVTLIASLYLEPLPDSDGQSIPRCIQKRKFDVQLAEKYRHNPAADALLVTHAGVTIERLQVWRQLLTSMQVVHELWNASYYDHLDFRKIIEQGQTLEEHFKNRSIIILNDIFRGSSQPESVLQKLPRGELYRIGQYSNIKTYIVGDKFDHQILLPAAEEIKRIEATVIKERVVVSNHEKLFNERVNELQEQLRKDMPLLKYILFTEYQGQKLSGVFQYQLGEIKVVPICNISRMRLLHITVSDIDPPFIKSLPNLYATYKSLHFERKIEALGKVTNERRPIVEQAIISDLADELWAFSQENWTGKWNEDLIIKHLHLLNIFLEIDWQHIFLKTVPKHDEEFQPEFPKSAQKILLTVRAVASLNVQTRDYVLVNRRKRILKNAVETLISKNEQLIFEQEWQKAFDQIMKSFENMTPEQLWQQVRFPNLKDYYQDNQEALSVVIPAQL